MIGYLAGLILLFGTIMILEYVEMIGRQNGNKIYDHLHKSIYDLSDYRHILTSFLFLSLGAIAFNGKIPECIDCFTILGLIRLAWVSFTVFPSSEPQCDQTRLLEPEESKYLIWSHRCHDKIFSYHFSLVFLAGLILLNYQVYDPAMIYGGLIIYGFLLISTRTAFTVDVLIAGIITWLVYTNPILGNVKFLKVLHP